MTIIARMMHAATGLILTAALLLLGFICASVVLGSWDVRTEHFKSAAAIWAPETMLTENVQTADGDFVVNCSNPSDVSRVGTDWEAAGDPDWAQLRCQIRDGNDTRIFAEIIFGEDTNVLEPNLRNCAPTSRFLMLSRVWPHARIAPSVLQENALPTYDDVNLTSHERQDDVDSIGSVSPLCLVGFEVTTDLAFTLEAPSVQAVVGNALNQAMAIVDQDITAASRDRVADVVVGFFDQNSDTFEVRRMYDSETGSIQNGLRILLSGSFEFFILSLGFVALFGSILAVIVVQFARSIGTSFGRLSVRLGGLLTYLGLLGTLLGVFGAVQALSGIEFLNEFRKVFEQTASFGAMSLAVGTSVVGLGAAVTVGLVQSFLATLTKTDPFRE